MVYIEFLSVLFKPLYWHTQANQAQQVSGISQCTWGCGITSPQCHTFGAQCGAQIDTGAYETDELVYQLLFIELSTSARTRPTNLS